MRLFLPTAVYTLAPLLIAIAFAGEARAYGEDHAHHHHEHHYERLLPEPAGGERYTSHTILSAVFEKYGIATPESPQWLRLGRGMRAVDVFEGRGEAPNKHDKVYLHLIAYGEDGSVLLNSYTEKAPTVFYYETGDDREIHVRELEAIVASMKHRGKRFVALPRNTALALRLAEMGEVEQVRDWNYLYFDVTLYHLTPFNPSGSRFSYQTERR